ncbi:MAG: L,D-transpeptidase family protein [Rhodopseudomonas palustris]|uniref:L,D-transpeptidase family protein n=1 Tax=Rhodopseudomonas palustris TaxID=1076 RepID=A0A933S1E3_RHOPL|nr:L,D-transpeptidase family protein [Rhodopseudomonas palustris]
MLVNESRCCDTHLRSLKRFEDHRVRLEQSSMSSGLAPRPNKSDLAHGVTFKAAWRAGMLTAAGVFALSSEAQASNWWWPENDSAVYTPAPPAPKRYQRKHYPLDTKQEKLIEKQTAKPQGPLVISVSIDQQKLRVFDANGFFAETPVSTGMRGHSTPMGVFSVIQKNKWHRSNIYSGAPMPYMQRITWSGIALHAGVVPGYPASHGCIRLPNAFAMKMWGWTRMGARVIVTPGDITPTSFSHALLASKRPAPPDAPMASDPQKPTTSSKSDKAAAADPAAPNAELRAGISLDDPRPVTTADASAASVGATAVLSDSPARADSAEAAPPSLTAASADARAEASIDTIIKDDAAKDDTVTVTTPSTAETKTDAVDPATTATVDKTAEPKASDSKAVESNTSTAEKPAVANDKAPVVESLDKADAAAQSKDPSKDASKDQSRATDPTVPPAAELPAAKRGGGQIAVFISGKDQKLYVRQNMTPLFDVPVSIAASERPLGTHVFTAELAKDDGVRWTVVSLPASRRAEVQSNSRRSKKDLVAEAKVSLETDGPAAALDRLTVPPEAMARIAEAITSGASLVVSDQGITASGETGQGTDFIIRLR